MHQEASDLAPAPGGPHGAAGAPGMPPNMPLPPFPMMMDQHGMLAWNAPQHALASRYAWYAYTPTDGDVRCAHASSPRAYPGSRHAPAHDEWYDAPGGMPGMPSHGGRYAPPGQPVMIMAPRAWSPFTLSTLQPCPASTGCGTAAEGAVQGSEGAGEGPGGGAEAEEKEQKKEERRAKKPRRRPRG